MTSVAVAYIHDLGYGEILEKGGNPYIHFSDADKKALANFDFSSYGGILGKGFFALKKAAHKAGLIGKYDADGNMGFLDKKLRNSSKKALQASAAGRKAFDEVELEHDLTRQTNCGI